MAISEGQTRITLQLDGKGNAVAHMKQVEGGFAVLVSKAQMLGEAGEKLAAGLERNFEKARKGTMTFKDGLDTALDVASAFGPIGKIISGVGKSIAAVVDGLWDLFATTPKFSELGTAILTGVSPAWKLAGAMNALATQAASAAGQLTNVKNSALEAAAATARSRGDEDAAKRFEAQAALNVSQDDVKARKEALLEARKRVTDASTAIPQIKRQLADLDQQVYAATMQGDEQAAAAATAVMVPLRAALGSAQAALKDAIPAVEAAYDDYTASLSKLQEDALRAQPGFVEFTEDEAGGAMKGDLKPDKKAEAERKKKEEDDKRKEEAARKREQALERELALERAVDDVHRMQIEHEQWAADVRAGEMTEREFALRVALQMLEAGQELARQDEERLENIREYNELLEAANDNKLRLAGQLSEYSDALSGVAPGVAAFADALQRIVSTSHEAATAQEAFDEAQKKGVKGEELFGLYERSVAAQKAHSLAVRESITVGVQAAASFIKNENAKQAVLAITQLGLAFGALAMGDFGAAAGHFTAATILGAQAFGSGAGSGGARGKEPPRNLSAFRESSQPQQAQYHWHINAPFFGNPQESSRAFRDMERSADGTGFEEAA